MTPLSKRLTNDVLTFLLDGDVVAEILGMIPLRLIKNLVVRVDPLYAQLFPKVGSDSRDVGQRVAFVYDALDVGVGVPAGVDGVNHICDVEA